MANLSRATARSVLRTIDKYTVADFDGLGITQQHFELATGEQPWRRDHIHAVMKTLNAILFGTLEQLAMPKIQVPAEYVAAIVASFVAPGNRMVACVWLASERKTGVGALELAARAHTDELVPTSATQLFALVVELSDTDESTQARLNFLDRLGLAFANAEGERE